MPAMMRAANSHAMVGAALAQIGLHDEELEPGEEVSVL